MSLNIIQSKNGLKAVGFLLLFVFSLRVPLLVYFQYTDKYADNPTTGIRVGCPKKPISPRKIRVRTAVTSCWPSASRCGLFWKGNGKSKHILFFGCFTSRTKAKPRPEWAKKDQKAKASFERRELAWLRLRRRERSLFLPIYIIRCSNFLIRKHKDKITFDFAKSGSCSVNYLIRSNVSNNAEYPVGKPSQNPNVTN